mmetsp:Transcript_133497/g.232057  ORF Transcript_133497/g.232057 Transcript_133497/m.232057 type:complete len:680 (+) Transcript_133497:102-2141(+)
MQRRGRTPSPDWRSASAGGFGQAQEIIPWTPMEVLGSSTEILRCRYALEPVVTWNLRKQDNQGGLAVTLLRKWHSHFGSGSGQAVYDARKFGRELAVAWHCNSMIVDGIAAASCSLAGDLLPYIFQLVEADPGVTVSDLLGRDPTPPPPFRGDLSNELRDFELFESQLDGAKSAQPLDYDDDDDMDLFMLGISKPGAMGKTKSGGMKKKRQTGAAPKVMGGLQPQEPEPVLESQDIEEEDFLENMSKASAPSDDGEENPVTELEDDEEPEKNRRFFPEKEMVNFRGMIITTEQRDKILQQKEHERQAKKKAEERRARKEELRNKAEEKEKEALERYEHIKVAIAVRINWHLQIRDHSIKGNKISDLETFYYAMSKNPNGFVEKSELSAGLRSITARAHDITDRTIEVFVKAFDRTCRGGISLEDMQRVWDDQKVRESGRKAAEEKRKNRLKERQTMSTTDKRKMRAGAQNVVSQVRNLLRGGHRKVYGQLVYNVKSFFRAIDRDGSGDVSAQELMKGLRRLDVFASFGDIKAMVDVIDADCSGAVEIKELKQWIKGSMVAAMVARGVRDVLQGGRIVNDEVVHNAADLFDALDSDGTGALSSAEVRDGLRSLHLTIGARELNKFVDLLDKDHGGDITKDEFVFCIEGASSFSQRANARIQRKKEDMKKGKFGVAYTGLH